MCVRVSVGVLCVYVGVGRARHRASARPDSAGTPPPSILPPSPPRLPRPPQVIKTATVPAAACKRANTMQFHSSKIRFPMPRVIARPSGKEFRTLYKAKKPNVALF